MFNLNCCRLPDAAIAPQYDDNNNSRHPRFEPVDADVDVALPQIPTTPRPVEQANSLQSRAIMVYSYLSRVDIICLFTIFTIFLLFIPIIIECGPSTGVEDYYKSISNKITQLVVAVSLGFAIPIFLDIALDSTVSFKIGGVEFSIIRFISVITLILINSLILFHARLDNAFTIELCSYAHTYLQFGLCLWLFNVLDSNNCWTKPRALCILASYFLVRFFGAIDMTLARTVCGVIGLLIFIAVSFAWFRARGVTLRNFSLNNLPFQEYYITIVSLTCAILGIAHFITSRVYYSNPTINQCIIAGLRSILSYMLCVLPGRMQRQSTLQALADSEANTLKEILKVKQNFVRYVGHEIRTPLNIVSLGMEHLSDTLQQVRRVPQDTLDNLQELRLSCQTAVFILDDLLSYEKIESGLLTLEKTRVRVGPFLEKTLSPFRLFAAQNETNLHMNYGTIRDELNRCEMMVDQKKISQVLRNLTSNAIKFSRVNGTVEVNINLVRTSSQKKLRIDVVDSGVGISRDNLGRLFGNGVQFDAAANQGGGGSGMGLWISKEIIDMHNGLIGCHSAGLGHGSTFFIEISLEDETDLVISDLNIQEQQVQSLAIVSVPTTVNVSKPFDESIVLDVLIVDDSTPNRKILRAVVKTDGHRCHQASDGLDAIETVKKSIESGKPMDVILMDYQMPEMDGPSACEVLRKTVGFRGAIIGVTGMASDEANQEFLMKGADRVLLKPISREALFTAIYDTLNHKTQLDE